MKNDNCEMDSPNHPQDVPLVQVRFRKLFIGGIDSSLTENDIKAYFSRYGSVTGCTIHRDRFTGRSRGFGFITFDNPSSVDAVQESRPHLISGCEVTLKRAVPKELFQEFDGLLTVNRIFVGGLRQEVEEKDLREYFGAFGRVRKVDVMVDRLTNAKRGFAFVEYEDYDPVDKVVLRGKHTILGQEVTVKKAKSRLEMELLKQRNSIPQTAYPDFMRRRSVPFDLGGPLGILTRSSLDSLQCPWHNRYGDRRRRFF